MCSTCKCKVIEGEVEMDSNHALEDYEVAAGNTVGTLTYREGKITRLLEWLEQESETLDGAYFYSDSRNDLPLLLKVDHPQVVNPDPVLREHAQKAGWPIHHWV